VDKRIRVLIADDHPVIREGLRGLIATEPGMILIGEASDGDEAVERSRALQPDVVLLDLVMPRKDGLSAIGEIRKAAPNARILVLTALAEDAKIFPALKAGADGYLIKDSSPQELLEAISNVYLGGSPLDSIVARRVVDRINRPEGSRPEDTLTEREREVLCLVAQGLSNKDIAERLVTTERTVRSHMGSILQKLQLENRTQAALYALRVGIAELNTG
jgi:two-component system, NarL family, response regulator LiaR